MSVIIIAAVVTFFVMLPVLDWLVEKYMTRSFWRNRSAVLAQRSPQPDSAFLAAVKAEPEDFELVLIARRALAFLCSLPAEMIHSGDTGKELARILGKFYDDLDDLDLQRQVERELGLSINELPFLPSLFGRLRVLNWRFGGATCVGTWAVEVAREIGKRRHNLRAADWV